MLFRSEMGEMATFGIALGAGLAIGIAALGEEENEALRVGLVLNQFVVSIEISCLPKDLPHGIDVDVSSLALGEHLSLTDLVLPEGVTITSLQHEDVEAHDQTVCSVTEPKIIIEEEIEEPVDGELEGTARKLRNV